MVTATLIPPATGAWRAAACSLQRPEIYECARGIMDGRNIEDLKAALESAGHQR